MLLLDFLTVNDAHKFCIDDFSIKMYTESLPPQAKYSWHKELQHLRTRCWMCLYHIAVLASSPSHCVTYESLHAPFLEHFLSQPSMQLFVRPLQCSCLLLLCSSLWTKSCFLSCVLLCHFLLQLRFSKFFMHQLHLSMELLLYSTVTLTLCLDMRTIR